jgi:uncharacterized protein (TIGR02466 family)
MPQKETISSNDRIAVLKKALLQNPNDPGLHIQFISNLIGKQNYQEADAPSQRALKRFPQSTQLILLRAQVLSNLGKFQPAKHLLNALLSKAPDTAVAHILLGLIDTEQGADQQAIDHFETAASLMPDDCQASFFAASLYLKHLALEDAEKALKQTLHVNPDHIGALKCLGDLMINTNRYGEAIAPLQRVFELSEGDDNSAASLVMAQSISNERKSAVKLGFKFHHQFPNSIVLKEAYALALIRDGAFEQALEVCDSIIHEAQNPTTGIAYKATALIENGEKDAAMSLLCMDDFATTGMLPTPTGWADLDTFNDALIAQIMNHQTLADHDSNRSLIHAQDTLELFTGYETGAIKDLRTTIEAYVAVYMNALKCKPEHPFRKSQPQKYHLEAWANVYTRTGRQLSHFHPPAWLSGVYYPKMPLNLGINDTGKREGGLELGSSYYRLDTKNEIPTTVVEPVAGSIILFPSYVGHNTIPITETDESRISIAFNIIGA